MTTTSYETCTVCSQPAWDTPDSSGIVLCTGCARDYILGLIELPTV